MADGDSDAKAGPKPGAILTIFAIVNIFSIIIALLVAIAQALLIWRLDLDNIQVAIRIYVFVFCIAICVAEMEWTQKLPAMAVVNNWPLRGAAYAFIGLLTLELSNFNFKGHTVVEGFVKAMGWIMIGLGALYFLMGVCRLRQYRDKRAAHYDEVVKAKAAQDEAASTAA